MPVRVSLDIRKTLRAIARLQPQSAPQGQINPEFLKRYRRAFRQVQRQLISNLEQEARAEATEMVRYVVHSMRLSGRPTSAESQRLLIEQETAELLEEKLLSNKKQK